MTTRTDSTAFADLVVGHHLARNRIRAEKTHIELAEAIGVSPAELERFEAGQQAISPLQLFSAARYFRLNIAAFFQPLPSGEVSR